MFILAEIAITSTKQMIYEEPHIEFSVVSLAWHGICVLYERGGLNSL